MESQRAFIPRSSHIYLSELILSVATCEAMLPKKTLLPANIYYRLARLQQDDNLSKWEIAALLHIYTSSACSGEKSWVPIPSTAINKLNGKNAKAFRSALDSLVQKKLIQQYIYDEALSWTYDLHAGKCKQYCLLPSLSLELFELIQPEKVLTQPFLNVSSGKESTVKPRHNYRDMSRMQKQAAACLKPCCINLLELYRYIQNLKIYIDKARQNSPNMNLEEITESARASQLNDIYCYASIVRCIDREMTSKVKEQYAELAVIHTCYRSTSTGRFVDDLGPAFMSLSRGAKSAALDSLPPDFEVYNHDLCSSQLLLLRELLRTARLAYGVVDDFLKVDKKERAERIGLSVEVYKKCLYAWVFGATLSQDIASKTEDKLEELDQKIVEYILEAVGYDSFQDTYNRLYEELEPLQSTRGKLVKFILTPAGWQKLGGKVNRETVSLTNLAGKTFDAKEYVKPRKQGFKIIEPKKSEGQLSRPLLAHILQGMESALMHQLTILANDFGINIYLNQHDGLVSDKPIPKELFQKAAAKFDFQNLEFMVKAIA